MPSQITLSSVNEDTGEVNCECNPVACCLYPWPNPDDESPLYPATDLPESITVSFGGSDYTFTRSGYVYTGSIGDDAYIVSAQDPGSSIWVLQRTETIDNVASSGCLIGTDWIPETYSVSDTFSNSYIATYDGNDIEITRQSLCVWSGSIEGVNIILRYDDSSYVWRLLRQADGGEVSDINQDGQSTPIGDYGATGVTVA